MLVKDVIHWQRKIQIVTALSSAENETYSSVEAGRALVHLRLLLRELCLTQKEPAAVYEDNSSTISLATGAEQP